MVTAADQPPAATGSPCRPTSPRTATALIASGETLAAAIDAALPVALVDGYVTAEDVDLLDGPAEPGYCGWCSGTGEGVTPLHVCYACRGSGVEQVAS
jgi:hypothetical protein